MLSELQLTLDQRAVLEELNNALISAGSRLRELLTEYSSVNQRIQALQQQLKDLEDEYTKLVEQQLGEA
jgi:predicted nuclease with TOPRIM domain